MASWEEWFQDVAGSVIDKATQSKFVQPYEIDRLRLQALGDLGQYNEGQPMQRNPQAGGMSEGTILLIGGVLLAVLMLKD